MIVEQLNQGLSAVSVIVTFLVLFSSMIASYVSLKNKVDHVAVVKREKIERLERQHHADITRLEGADRDITNLLNSRFADLHQLMVKTSSEVSELKGFIKAKFKE